MNLNDRKDLLVKLGIYLGNPDDNWHDIKRKATAENNWFITEFIDLAVKNIQINFLAESHLNKIISDYKLPFENRLPKKVGIVAAGNIPLVGIHDIICVFMTGNYSVIKPSVKDEVLITHLVDKLIEWDKNAAEYFKISGMIPNCEAYIATGSNNASRYFEYYFRKYPSIIRKNRTSVAILTGNESIEELNLLSDDVLQFFGLGCRNVTKIYVPHGYDFVPLLNAFKKYDYLINHHKYKNNYDYNLALHILNNKFYMTNNSILLVEDKNPFSPIAQLHYEYYSNSNAVFDELKENNEIQCIVSSSHIAFGSAQCPAIDQYADNVDTIAFLLSMENIN